MKSIDINCDMGEGFGPWPMGNDPLLIQFISSANIACGFHAGDPVVMRETVRLALKHHVAIGAHPGFPDLQGFGRRNMSIPPDDLYAMVLYQIGALKTIVESEGGRLHHVKPHGALYNMAAKDPTLAKALAKAIVKVDPDLLLYGLSGSALTDPENVMGLRTGSEVFMDRQYQPDGTLTARTQPNALIEDVNKAVAQALHMINNGTVTALSGEQVAVKTETICLHGDGKNAVEFAQKLYENLKKQLIQIRTL